MHYNNSYDPRLLNMNVFFLPEYLALFRGGDDEADKSDSFPNGSVSGSSSDDVGEVQWIADPVGHGLTGFLVLVEKSEDGFCSASLRSGSSACAAVKIKCFKKKESGEKKIYLRLSGYWFFPVGFQLCSSDIGNWRPCYDMK